jgi:hypothetical protein
LPRVWWWDSSGGADEFRREAGGAGAAAVDAGTVQVQPVSRRVKVGARLGAGHIAVFVHDERAVTVIESAQAARAVHGTFVTTRPGQFRARSPGVSR